MLAWVAAFAGHDKLGNILTRDYKIMLAAFLRLVCSQQAITSCSQFGGATMTEEERYKRAWRNLDIRRGLVSVLFVFLLVTRFSGPQFFSSFDWSFFEPSDILSFIFAFIWLAIFSCPKCGKRFNLKMPSWGVYPFNHACVHCGLQKGHGSTVI